MLWGCQPVAFCIWTTVAPLLLRNNSSNAPRFETLPLLAILAGISVSVFWATGQSSAPTETSPEPYPGRRPCRYCGPTGLPMHASFAAEVQHEDERNWGCRAKLGVKGWRCMRYRALVDNWRHRPRAPSVQSHNGARLSCFQDEAVCLPVCAAQWVFRYDAAEISAV